MTTEILPKPSTKRFLSVDVFRGACIALMFVVNDPGSWSHIYPPLKHSFWNGCTITDLVFPFFLFTVGMSAAFSLKKLQAAPRAATYRKIFVRFVKIFLIGLLLNIFLIKDWSTIRILGVLQRIALVYLAGSFLCIAFSKRVIVVVTVVLTFGYWFIVANFSDPNHPYSLAIQNAQGEYVMDSASLAANVVTRVDRYVLGSQHLWMGKGIPFDPEGLLSTLPAIVTYILGFWSGLYLLQAPEKRRIIKVFLSSGLACWLVSMGWNYLLPINKYLWTSSFVLNTAGIALIIMSALVYLIDVRGVSKHWLFFLQVMGMNSILAFVLSGVWDRWMGYEYSFGTIGGYLYEKIFMPIGGGDNPFSSLLYALAHLAFFWFILWIFYRKKIFIKV